VSQKPAKVLGLLSFGFLERQKGVVPDMSKLVVVVGLDPGVTSGFAFLKGRMSDKYSSGEWDVAVGESHVDELQEIGDSVIESQFRSSEGWWQKMSSAGLGMAMKVCASIASEKEWSEINEEGGEEHLRDSGGDGGLLAAGVMEDFILRPENGSKGIAGRNAITPVAIGSSFCSLFMQMNPDARFLISAPSAKSVVTNEQLKRWFGDVCRGKPHGQDALRHAVLGVRQLRLKEKKGSA